MPRDLGLGLTEQRVVRLEDHLTATAIDISPDGRWIAFGVSEEALLLAHFHDGRVVCRVEGVEAVSIRFSPDGRTLASACVFLDGAYVRLDSVAREVVAGEVVAEEVVTGRTLDLIAELDRPESGTRREDFVDRLGDLSFSPDGNSLLLWETAVHFWEVKPRGWRGNLVCFDVASRQLLWVTSVDEALTGDPRSLHEIGRDFGYLAPFAFDASGRSVGLGIGQQLLVLDAGTGASQKVLRLDDKILGLGHDAARGCWLLATDGGGLRPFATDAK